MFPTSPTNNRSGCSSGNTELGSNVFDGGLAFGVNAANVEHLLSRKHGTVIAFALGGSSFRGGIPHVDTLVPDKQMFGTDTASVVAFMKHPKSFWNWTYVDSVRKTMRRIFLTTALKMPVSMFSLATSPNPTVSKVGLMRWCRSILVNLRPEPFFLGWSKFKMRNVAARIVSACMDKQFTLRHCSKREKVRKAMRGYVLVVNSGLAVARFFADSAFPGPARIWTASFINAFPERFRGCFRSAHFSNVPNYFHPVNP